MLKVYKKKLIKNYTNYKGWKTKRKIIVIESDDWGSIMMKDQETYNNLLKKGIAVDNSKYSMLDCLENRKDLNDLFNVLKSHTTDEGYSPKFTFNTVMENPDFEKIKELNFTVYQGEKFNDSYKKYYNEDNMDIWRQAIEEDIMLPQFHAKEHFNRFFWMNDLQNKNLETLIGFENSFFGIGIKTSSSYRKHYLATYNSETVNEQILIQDNLKDGLNKFTETFGFDSKTFIGSNYTWTSELESLLETQNILGIQGQRVQFIPNLNNEGAKYIRHYTGQKNSNKQIYTVRNCIFEPYENPNIDWIDITMRDIKNAFFWNTPAIIVTHRINYVSTLSKKHQELNLNLLNQLLKKIINYYPDVEFLTSDELFNTINK
jgi:hypothetical protein